MAPATAQTVTRPLADRLEIGRLKAEPGEIIAHGGTQFVRSLVRLGLVDRYHFYVVQI
jgi:dihydrofolate reductase